MSEIIVTEESTNPLDWYEKYLKRAIEGVDGEGGIPADRAANVMEDEELLAHLCELFDEGWRICYTALLKVRTGDDSQDE